MPNNKMTQLTIVTHYGEKPSSMANLITVLQNKLAVFLGSAFKPYEIEQVHGTIIGLECRLTANGIINQWNEENLKKDESIDLSGLLKFVLSDRIGKIEIRIGGWQPHKDYGFESRNQHPYLRSFSLQGDVAVAMGWPIKNGKYSESLYLLRRSFEDFNVCHKYNKEGYKDNDFFFVIGRISKAYVTSVLLEQTVAEIRHILSGINEIISIVKETISIVAYIDPQLPKSTSKAFSLIDSGLNPQLIEGLYKQGITYRPN